MLQVSFGYTCSQSLYNKIYDKFVIILWQVQLVRYNMLQGCLARIGLLSKPISIVFIFSVLSLTCYLSKVFSGIYHSSSTKIHALVVTNKAEHFCKRLTTSCGYLIFTFSKNTWIKITGINCWAVKNKLRINLDLDLNDLELSLEYSA